jgi:alpha-1,2-mannosyltransferase
MGTWSASEDLIIDAAVLGSPSRAARKAATSRRGLGGWGVLSTGLLIAAASIWAVGFLDFVMSTRTSSLARDFRYEYLPAAHAVMHGRSPYPALDAQVFDAGRVYVYPPLVAFLSVPISVLPGPVFMATALAALCVPLSLWLLGVGDWRCYVATLLWVPVFSGIQTANVTLPLLLGCAACWRFRDRPAAVSMAGGLTVAAKLLAWPMVVWLVATRRLLAAVTLLVVALGATVSLWTFLGFAGLADFPSNLERLQQSDAQDVYSVSTLAWEAGFSERTQTLLWLSVALVALVGVVAFGRRGDDARSYSCAMVAAILASPIVWLHSFAFLLVPLALLRPRFSAIWMLPAAMWLFAKGSGHPAPLQTALTLVIAGLVVAAALLPRRLIWSPCSRAKPLIKPSVSARPSIPVYGRAIGRP